MHDVGREVYSYVYTLHGRMSKGANRWCTSILHAIRALKTSNHQGSKARTLILIGDNYGENKNNINLDFICELVGRGWFDEVQLLFGPVGHTHNGIDATHKIHNDNCGTRVAGTLGEWAMRFPTVFAANAPKPIYLKNVYNFHQRYQTISAELHGFTRTENNESVHAFRVALDKRGGVALWWAQHPSLRPGIWRGATGKEGDEEGLLKLLRLPVGDLEQMRTNYDCIPAAQSKDVTSKALSKLLCTLRMPGVFDWCGDVVRLGCLPLGPNLGRQGTDLHDSYTIGVAPNTCTMEVWDVLPGDVMEVPPGERPEAIAPPPPLALPVSTTALHNYFYCAF